MRLSLEYLKFLLRSTNHHGIHSPFIYAYLTRCLYVKPARHKEPVTDLLFKSIPYFGVKSVGLHDTGLAQQLEKYSGELRYQQPPYDLFYMGKPDVAAFMAHCENAAFHNDTICVVHGIHASRSARLCWEAIRAYEESRVTVDFFHCGLVFFRKEQAPQHFTIRI